MTDDLLNDQDELQRNHVLLAVELILVAFLFLVKWPERAEGILTFFSFVAAVIGVFIRKVRSYVLGSDFGHSTRISFGLGVIIIVTFLVGFGWLPIHLLWETEKERDQEAIAVDNTPSGLAATPTDDPAALVFSTLPHIESATPFMPVASPEPTATPALDTPTVLPSPFLTPIPTLPLTMPPALVVMPTASPTPTIIPTDTPSLPAVPFRGSLAFVSPLSGNEEIYIVDFPDLTLHRLTDDDGRDLMPAWSPDGNFIYFASDRGGNWDIYVMDVCGGTTSNLTNHPAVDKFPSVSPDGSRIAFVSNRDGNQEIYVMNADGTNPTQITDSSYTETHPAWSPDGNKIAFQSLSTGNGDIYLVDSNSKVYLQNSNGNIYLAYSNGDHVQRLTQYTAEEGYPSWSPDGHQIAFMSQRDGQWQLDLVDVPEVGADGQRPRVERLTWDDAQDWFPSWSSDGKWIAFSSMIDSNYEIYVISATDVSMAFRVTWQPGDDQYPAWRPFSDSARVCASQE